MKLRTTTQHSADRMQLCACTLSATAITTATVEHSSMPSQKGCTRCQRCLANTLPHRLRTILGLLLALLLLGALLPFVSGSLPDDFIRLPAEFAAKVPARLVLSQDELIQCWREGSAHRCVLTGASLG